MNSDIQITSENLKPMAMMPQGLDNQFVPLQFLKKILNSNGSLSRVSIRDEIKNSIQAEFLRSLIYGEQLVLNRAFIINTPEIYSYLLRNSKERDSFIDLIKSKSIIPWLFDEHSLDEKPIFHTDDIGWSAVCELIKDYKEIPCLKFSWDDDENSRYINNLTLTFTEYILGIPAVADKIATDFIENEFGVTEKTRNDFKNILGQVAKFTIDTIGKKDQSYITREELYKEFICVEGTNIPDGYYDSNKPFSLSLKLLFDLKYQVNLPEIFDIQSLTSHGLPSKTSLHELDMPHYGHDIAVLLDIPKLIGDLLFSEIQSSYWLKSINYLKLSDVKNARNSDEWKQLMNVSSNLNTKARNAVVNGKFDTSLEFSTFWESYLNYQLKLSGMVENAMLEEIKPQAYIQLRMGEIVFNINPINKYAILAGNANSLRDRITPFETGIIVGSEGKISNDLGYNFEFLRTKIQGARDQFENILKQLKREKYRIDKTKYIAPSKESSITDSADYLGLKRIKDG